MRRCEAVRIACGSGQQAVQRRLFPAVALAMNGGTLRSECGSPGDCTPCFRPASRLGHSTKLPALRGQPAQQRRQIHQPLRDQVPHLTPTLHIALPHTPHRHQA